MSIICRAIIFILLSVFNFSYITADVDPAALQLLTDKGYAKHMEVQTYIVTKNQINILFSKGKIVQKLNKDFNEQDENYLVVRVKNKGDRYAIGTLKCRVPNCDRPIMITVVSTHGRKDSPYQTWVVPLGDIAIDITEKITRISCSWDDLYTY